MAMYEREGFCPTNSFLHYAISKTEDEAESIKKRMDILGDRTGYMVYDSNHVAYGTKWPSVVELLLSNDMGEDVAKLLVMLVPECKYAEIGKKICIKDVINPLQIPDLFQLTSRSWSLLGQNGTVNINNPVRRKDEKFLFFDDEYVVVIEDGKEAIVMWVFRYPSK